MRENPSLLIADPTRELRAFQVAMTRSIGTKRGRGRGSFIDSVLEAIDSFYAEVLQHLKAWSAAPPKLRPEADAIATEPDNVPVALVSTALSSQDDASTQPAASRASIPASVPAAALPVHGSIA